MSTSKVNQMVTYDRDKAPWYSQECHTPHNSEHTLEKQQTSKTLRVVIIASNDAERRYSK